MKHLLIFLIKAYRLVISPLFPAGCRYSPTCSRYGLNAIERFGAIKGSILTIGRICRCHPWGGYGYDPVPETFDYKDFSQVVLGKISHQKSK
jgi:putative membrane protein insertion efficiency factor